MKLWLSLHRQAVRHSLQRLWRQPWSSLLNILVIAVALSLPLGLYVLVQSVQAWAGNLPAKPEISIYLRPNAERALSAQIEARLKTDTRVASYRYVGKQDALNTLAKRKGIQEAVASLESNPLPDSFVLQSKDNTPEGLALLEADLKSWPHVAHVQYDAAWARKLQAFLDLGEKLVLVLALALGFALIVVAGNTVRLQILTRREEIEVSKLIGATDGFIRRPFLYFSLIQGALGGLAAGGLVSLASQWLSGTLHAVAAQYRVELPPVQLSWLDLGSLGLFAGGLCLVGAMFSVNRHLQDIEPG